MDVSILLPLVHALNKDLCLLVDGALPCVTWVLVGVGVSLQEVYKLLQVLG